MLFDAVQMRDGIEDQQARPQGGNCLLEEPTIPLEIESRAHDVLGVLGGIAEHPAGLPD